MLLKEILNRVVETSLDGAEPPAYEGHEKDKVVGVLPDDLKRLFLVKVEESRRLDGVHERMAIKAETFRGGVPQEEKNKIIREHALAHIVEKVVNDLFWTSVRSEFPQIADERQIGVNKRWEVVVPDPEVEAKIALKEVLDALMKEIFG